jgi:hypothetical protein
MKAETLLIMDISGTVLFAASTPYKEVPHYEDGTVISVAA